MLSLSFFFKEDLFIFGREHEQRRGRDSGAGVGGYGGGRETDSSLSGGT